MDEKRGYKDIDPENCWEQWQEARKMLADPRSNEAQTHISDSND